MLIGLNGYKGSGKDTVATYLVEHHGFHRLAFADKLKESVCNLLDIDPIALERLKNLEEDCRVTITIPNKGELCRDISFRHFLQRYGTESHRDTFGTDFWVDQILPSVGAFYAADQIISHLNRDIVITDARFENEQKRIHDLKGYNIRVKRGTSVDEHLSEAMPKYLDQVIDNEGTLDELPAQIEEVLHILNDEEQFRLGG